MYTVFNFKLLLETYHIMETKKVNRDIIRYLVADERDSQFGVIVNTVGRQITAPNQIYPPIDIHPNEYFFRVDQGRVLTEYQLLYIINGKGTLHIDGIGDFCINAGEMFLIYPHIRHTYKPDKKTGWSEYWIGFSGSIIDDIVKNSFLSPSNPLLKVGLNERIIDLYIKAMEIAEEGRAGYQQALAGIVMHILGLASYRDRTHGHDDQQIINKMNQVKLIMREAIYDKLDLEKLASDINMSYSNFRKTFKEFIGVSPSYYYQELKLDEAKLLLSTSNKSIKEISFKLSYDNPESFAVFFKKRTGYSPTEYRAMR